MVVIMHHSDDQALTTAHPDACLPCGGTDPKITVRDLLFSASQVGTAVSVCWVMHCLV